MQASASIKKPVQPPANREERNKDYVQIKASSINQTCRCCEAMTFGAHGQGRIQYIQQPFRPALQMPEARKSVTDKGNAVLKKILFNKKKIINDEKKHFQF